MAAVQEEPRLTEEEWDAYQRDLAREAKVGTTAFLRVETRRRQLKVQGDCGHWIDGSELYRYCVWKHYGDTGITQRIECEPCARIDLKY